MAGAARFGSDKAGGGVVITGAKKTEINNLPAARLGDLTQKHGRRKHKNNNPIVEGSKTVECEYRPLARAGHKASCDCALNQGSSNVEIGG